MRVGEGKRGEGRGGEGEGRGGEGRGRGGEGRGGGGEGRGGGGEGKRGELGKGASRIGEGRGGYIGEGEGRGGKRAQCTDLGRNWRTLVCCILATKIMSKLEFREPNHFMITKLTEPGIPKTRGTRNTITRCQEIPEQVIGKYTIADSLQQVLHNPHDM